MVFYAHLLLRHTDLFILIHLTDKRFAFTVPCSNQSEQCLAMCKHSIPTPLLFIRIHFRSLQQQYLERRR